MTLLYKLYATWREYTQESVLLKLEKEIQKEHPLVLKGDVSSAHRMWKLLSLRDNLKIE